MGDIERVKVDLGPRSYEVLVGSGLLERLGEGGIFPDSVKRAGVVVDGKVPKTRRKALISGLKQLGVEAHVMEVAPGEQSKSWERLREIVDWCLDINLEREDALIALGGGVIGDLTGFACSIVKRGLKLVQIPTTLLAQVDSSVGGKTGINDPKHGKNLIGTFHQPKRVIADVTSYKNLPKRMMLAGYSEIVKHALIADLELFQWLEKEGGKQMVDKSPEALVRGVVRSCEIKAKTVAVDETEKADRALLNFGHTFGHALETAIEYSPRLHHGEAVSIGMCMAMRLSTELGLFPKKTAKCVVSHFKSVGLKTELSEVKGGLPDAKTIVALMARDKKAKRGKPRFIVLDDIGKARVIDNVDMNIVTRILEEDLEKKRLPAA